MKPDVVIERLFDLLEKLIDKPCCDAALAARVVTLEARLAAMEAVWPQIVETQNGAN